MMLVAKISEDKNKFFFQLLLVAGLLGSMAVTIYSTKNPKSIFFSLAAKGGKKVCRDSDGVDIFVKGTISGPNLVNGDDPIDYCLQDPYGDWVVVEYGCSREDGWLYGTINPDLYSNSFKCQDVGTGDACVDGACTYPDPPQTYCEKNDGGDIYTKGHLSSDVSGVCKPDVNMCLDSIDDFCVSQYPGYNLIEYTCGRPSGYAKSWSMSNAVFENAVNCPNGCYDGACIGSSTQPTPTPVSSGSCGEFCRGLLQYSDGNCRANAGACNQNGEVHESYGDDFCGGGKNADTCCCL